MASTESGDENGSIRRDRGIDSGKKARGEGWGEGGGGWGGGVTRITKVQK